MNAYRFNIPAVGFGDDPSEAFGFILEHLSSAPQAILYQEIDYDLIVDPEGLRATLNRMLSLHEPAAQPHQPL